MAVYVAPFVKAELEAVMKPAFLNQIDGIVFQPLTDNELFAIAAMMSLGIFSSTKLERDIDITVDPALLQKMVGQGNSKASGQFGARPMRRAVQRNFEDAISDAVMKNFLISGDSATFDLKDDEVEACDLDDMRSYSVTVSQSRDEEIFSVEIEESCRDMVVEAIDNEAPGVTDRQTETGLNGVDPTHATA